MKEVDFKRFMFENKIKQSDLAKYLGVSEGYVSLVVSGRKKLSEENYGKVLNNPYGWDTSLLEEDKLPQLAADQIPQLSNVEILLRDLLAEKEAKIDALNEIIWELKAENARLQEQLRSKGGVVAGAEDSLSASA
jgi:transcriptional regulator with XRE-family HTH domain